MPRTFSTQQTSPAKLGAINGSGKKGFNFMASLKDKVIVITGGSRGIGLAIAESLAREGAHLVLNARNAQELDTAKAKVAALTKGEVLTVAGDVSKQADNEKLAQAVKSKFGKLYGVVAAAGIYGSIGKFSETPIEEWVKAIDINLTGTARTLHALYPLLKANGSGRVVLFSGGGQGPMANFSPYVTSKGGIWRFTETLGAEFAQDGIYLNAMAPGAVNTKLLDELLAAGPDKVGADFYRKSIEQRENGGQSAEKAAKLVNYLMSDRSKGLYGKTISAIWDEYEKFENLEQLSKSDVFCPRRVVHSDGRTR
jgi:NAD(P)-dependent dehydrogenase (short-subunit alcohol dehydrogenase family)